jgi:predicted permease
MSAANLCLARTASRRHELALRAALGVRRGRLARHLLTEALIVALSGGAAGAGLARVGVGVLRDSVPAALSDFVPGWAHLGVDTSSLFFALVASICAMLAFAILPVFRAMRVDISAVLSDGGRASTGVHGPRTRSVLVVLEVCIALSLLTSAALLMRSVNFMLSGNPGVRRDHVLTMHVSLASSLSDSAARDVYRRLDVALHAIPGVRAAGITNTTPLSNSSNGTYVSIPGRRAALDGEPLTAINQRTTPDYFRAAGIPLLAGRGITSADVDGAPRVVVVSKLLATTMWPKSEAVGNTVVIDSVPWTVVGVAADVRHHGFDEPVRMSVYRSIQQALSRTSDVAVWTSGDPAAMREVVRGVVAHIDPLAAVGDPLTMQEIEARHVSPFRMVAGLLAVLAIITIVIAAVGLYGLIAYGVAQRVREIGIRIALGARAGDILAHIGGGALRLVGVGVVAGVAGALGFTRLLGGLLYGVGPNDPRTLIGAALFLGATALAAALIPAWRATRVDPVLALRE